MRFFNRQGWALLIATAVTAGLMVCDGNGGENNGGTTPSHTHTWGEWVVTTPATCDASGVETRICTQDGTTETNVIAKLTGAACIVDPNTVVKGTFTDTINGQEYKTVKIGGQTWMAENLNYTPLSGHSWCYDDDDSNCDTYGRLYTWNAANTVCPAGWRLPTRDDWDQLIESVGGRKYDNYGTYHDWYDAGKKLKSATGWYSDSGTDEFGFSALPGGYRRSDGYFFDADYRGLWWTATVDDAGKAYLRNVYYWYDYVLEGHGDESGGFSVRCVEGN